MPDGNKEQHEKLLELVREAVNSDKTLREKYQVGEKFRFIRDRLNALLAHAEETLTTIQKEIQKSTNVLAEDEQLVYVYLFNAQGILVQSWQKMLTPTIFYDHSINRPIYTERSHIDALLKTKAKIAEHGFIIIAIKKQDVLKTEEGASLKDSLGNPLIKVREGALKFERLFSFYHNGHEYKINAEGELVKKE